MLIDTVDNQYKEILKWLSAPDPSTNFNAAHKRRHNGTGKWLLENKVYKDWKLTRGSFIWLHGVAGCGMIQPLKEERLTI